MLPADLVEQGGDTVRKARLIIGASVVCVLGAFYVGVDHFAAGYPLLGVIGSSLAIPGLLALFIARRTGRIGPAAQLLIATTFLILQGSTLASNGMLVSNAVGTSAHILAAIVLLGWRAGTAWGVANIAVTIVAGQWAMAGVEPLIPISPDKLQHELAFEVPLALAILVMCGLAFDLLKQRALDELAEANERAIEASRHKSAFLANMSHELRTPLNGVIGVSELLRETPLDERQRDLVQTIQTSARALVDLIGDILDFSKIEAGMLELDERSFRLGDMLTDVRDLNIARATSKGLRYEHRIDERIPPRLVGDPARLRQVLTNLAANAVKFTPAGEIRVTATLEETREAEIVVRLTVSDTGEGIPSEKLERIFESFTQADMSTTRAHGGTGLGLAISRQLVKAMGGTIGVRSTVGQGSEFWFTVVLREEKVPPELSEPRSSVIVSAHSTRSLHVLMVEDNEINREVAGMLLTSLGHTYDLAPDGEQALVMLQPDHLYDLILMDCRMPVMDGFETTRRIREHYGPGVPIIALTAGVSKDERQQCLDAGMDDVMAKPIAKQALQQMLDRWANTYTRTDLR
ncbi:MAG: ATP-binding protein [Myxococcota bacterium]